VFGQQFFVGGDHMLAAVDGGQHQFFGDASAADQFDHNVDVRVAGHGKAVGHHVHAVADDGAGGVQIQVGGHFQDNVTAGATADFRCVAL